MTATVDPVPRWSREVARLRSQAQKLRPGAVPTGGAVVDSALEVCESLLRAVAGAQLDCERLQSRVQTEVGAWDRLFDVMPCPCVLTDRGGVIVNANTAAGTLLNVSPRHLKDRQLLVFTHDREAFRVLLERRSRGLEEEVHGSLEIRPRERRPRQLGVRLEPVSPGADMWLWFFVPATEAGVSAHDPAATAPVARGANATDSADPDASH